MRTTALVRGGHLALLDAVVAIAVTAATAGIALDLAPHRPIWLVLPLAAAVGLPLAVRRRWSWPVVAVVVLASVTAGGVGVSHDPGVAVGLALYTATAAGPTRRAAWALVGYWVATASVTAAAQAAPAVPDWPGAARLVALSTVVSGAAWTLGRAVRLRRDSEADLAEQRVHRAVTDERLRIARELHDIVAHNMSLITVKAAVANHLLDSHPQQTGEALRMIETTGRQTLDDLRYLLGVLRADTATGGDPELVPSRGLADLEELTSQVARSGVLVELEVRAAAEPPAPVSLATYRIVQEALTNVVKHAAASRCVVTVDVGEHRVDVDVTDDGRGGTPRRDTSGGHGLLGVRERVALHGGSCDAGPLPTGGFRLRARLPYAAGETSR